MKLVVKLSAAKDSETILYGHETLTSKANKARNDICDSRRPTEKLALRRAYYKDS